MLFAFLCAPARSGDLRAASLSAHDLQVLSRALAFVQSAPSGPPVVAIAYAPGSETSRRDALAIAALLADGLRFGRALLRPLPVDTASLSSASFALLIAATGADGKALLAASARQKSLCVSGDFALVAAGSCAMAIRSEPRVEILLNHTAAAASGIAFAPAFTLMIREI